MELVHKEFEEDIKCNPKLITDKRKIGFFDQFYDVYSKKVGVDLYPITVFIQVIILFYTLLFYPLMDPSNTQNIEKVLQNNFIPT